MPNMPCKRACQTCLAKGLLLCKQACLVTGFFALQSRMPCERASSSTASAYIYIYFNLPSKWNGKKVLDSVHAQVSGLFGSEVQLA